MCVTGWKANRPQILGTVRGLDFLHSLGFAHGNIRPVPCHQCSFSDYIILTVFFSSQMNILVDDEHNARLSGFELVSLLDPGYQEARMVGGNHGALRLVASGTVSCLLRLLKHCRL
jgi:hypothetical protein